MDWMQGNDHPAVQHAFALSGEQGAELLLVFDSQAQLAQGVDWLGEQRAGRASAGSAGFV